jgi:nitrogen fixation protein
VSSIDNGLTPSTRMPKTTLEETILTVRNRLINLGELILKKSIKSV